MGAANSAISELNFAFDVGGNNGTVIDTYTRGINLIESDVHGYYLYNAHGDVVQLADGSGVVAKDYDYDAFGVQVDSDGGMRYTDVGDALFEDTDTNPWRYCGEYFDTETNTIYLRARYYDPVTGRFSSEDPIRDGLNWYTYCESNPIIFIDPSGLVEVEMWNYAKTYKGSTITYQDGPDIDSSFYTVSWNHRSFDVSLRTLSSGTGCCVDDSLFVNAFGVGTNTIVVYEDAITGNVSIRAAFIISGKAANNAIDGTTYRELFLQGIEEGWSNSTTSAYAREGYKGIKVNIKDATGTSNVTNFFGGFVELFWSPSNPGKATLYTNNYSADNFKIVAAHEFGHLLGIDDGYNNAVYQNYNSIMCDMWSDRNGTGRASSLDIETMLKAFQTKRFQKWN